MTIESDLVVDRGGHAPAASCVVCGNDIATGEGLTANYRGETLRFKCTGCLTRFSADPARYLTEGPAGCCGGHDAHSPASEWMCD